MNPENKALKVAGYVLNALIAALLLFAGIGKLSGSAPADVVDQLKSFGLGDRVQLLGTGEIITGVLLLVPITAPLGVLMASGFWGGVICIHMAHHQDFLFGSALLALTWLGGYLRGAVPLLALKPETPPASDG
jgi:hypothetical protein